MVVALIVISILLIIISFLFVKNLRKISFLRKDNEQLHQQSCEDRRLIDKYKQSCKDLEKENKELRVNTSKINFETTKQDDFTRTVNITKNYLKPQGIETVINVEKRLYDDKDYRKMIDQTACEKFGRIIYENHLYEVCEDYDIRLEEFNLRYRTRILVE